MDLTTENVSQALCCESLGGYHERGVEERRKFLIWRLGEGKVRGKIILEGGEKLGWVDYYPRSDGWVRIGCILVDEEHRGRGVGRALVEACLRDCRGSKGVIVAATVWEVMPKGFFKKCSFVDTDEKSNVSLMAVRFGEEGPPENEKELETRKYAPTAEVGKLMIDMFDEGECPILYVTRQLVKDAARDFGEKILIREYDTKDKEIVEQFGYREGIFLDGEKAFFGYPGKVEDIREALRKKLEAEK